MKFDYNQVEHLDLKLNYNLKHLTWFKVGGSADIFFKPKNMSDLIEVIQYSKIHSLAITLLGAGSNIIIRDKGIEGMVIKLAGDFCDIMDKDDLLSVGGACLNYNLAQFCLNKQISGFEFLCGIPGSIGGGVTMNAGAYGSEFKDIIVAIETIDSHGKINIIKNEDIGFKYRSNNLNANMIVTKAYFKKQRGNKKDISDSMSQINAKRNQTQPINEWTGGSTFANPIGCDRKAWQLLDKVGLRGYKKGGAMFSKLHCNFLINLGSACASDLENLGNMARDLVYQNFNILLNWEIKRIGRL